MQAQLNFETASPIQPTSRAAFESIKDDRERIKAKILEGMNKLPNGGNFEQIANACGLQPAKVWKRLSELERDQKIFNTGRTLPTSSNRQAIVWDVYKN